jgi:hypothetical protein
MNRIVKLAAAAVLGIAGAQAAEAAFVDITVQGVLDGGSIDVDGLFGDAGADLSGVSYAMTYRFNLLPGPAQVTGVGLRVRSDCCEAGAGYNNLRIKKYGLIFADQGSFFTEDADDGTPLPETGGLSALVARVSGSAGSVGTTVIASDHGFADFDFDAPFLLDLKSDGSLGGTSLFRMGGDDLSMSVTSIASTGAIPEPASWAMMVAGFGLAGAAMRRRTARSVA